MSKSMERQSDYWRARVEAAESALAEARKERDEWEYEWRRAKDEIKFWVGKASTLRAALEGAEEFIERVTGWTGTNEDEQQETLDSIRAALKVHGEQDKGEAELPVYRPQRGSGQGKGEG